MNQPNGFPSNFAPIPPPGQGFAQPTVWWWGSDTPTRSASAENLGLSAVTRATALIVNTITNHEFRTFLGSGEPAGIVAETAAPRWLTDPMLVRPDERIGPSPVPAALRLPRAAFWSQLLRSCVLRGMGYLIFEVGAEGQPLAGTLRVLHPDFVSPIETEAGYVARRIGSQDSSGVWVETDFNGYVQLGPRQYRLIELRNPLTSADDMGIHPGLLAAHAAELGLATTAADYGAGMMGSGVPSGYLQVASSTFTKAQADQLRRDWLEHHGGNRRSTAVLNASVSYTPIQLSPIDMGVLETRQMSLIDIANIFGVPVHLIGGSTSDGLTYSNAESRSLDFKTYSLLNWGNALEDVLSALLPLNQYVEVDWDALTRADTATRYASHHAALADGWKTRDEVRHEEGLGPLPASEAPAAPLAIEEGSA